MGWAHTCHSINSSIQIILNVFYTMPKEHQIWNFTYALKKVSLSNIRQAQYIESEKKLILQIEHPFIVKLVKALKDMKTLYSFINDYLDDLKFPEFIKDSQFKSLSKKLLNKIQLKDWRI